MENEKRKKVFGIYITNLFEATGLTIVEVAKKAATSLSLLSNIKTGRSTCQNKELLFRLADVFNVPYWEMLAMAGFDLNDLTLEVTEIKIIIKIEADIYKARSVFLRSLLDLNDQDIVFWFKHKRFNKRILK